MDILTVFLNKVAYRFPKGYPDINDEQDMLLLESILLENNIDIKNPKYRLLTFAELRKRPHRFNIIVDKIKNGEPFELANGDSTPLEFIKPNYASVFATEDADQVKSLVSTRLVNSFPFFKDDNNTEYTISNILKNRDFGGLGVGSGTQVEDFNLGQLNKTIQSILESTGQSSINVEVNGQVYRDIIGAKTQPGTPKSDFNLVNSQSQPIVFISHKKAGGKGADAKDFIRWSGFTQYFNHPEVKVFNEALLKFLQENDLKGVPPKTKFIAPIKDDELIRELIYGPNYGGEYNKDNVNIILQGKMLLEDIGDNTYKLSAQHVLAPPALPEGDYVPYLTSSYRSDRKMFGIPNNEAIAMTKATALSYSNIYELQDGEFIKIK